MNTAEHESEPVYGLPEELPPGEQVLWQGAPRWQSLAVRAFHARKLALYFGVLLAWRGAATLADGGSLGEAAVAVLWLVPLAVATLGIVALLAWWSCRTTVYTVTNRRVAMRIGIVLTITLNLPFRVIESVGLRSYRDGTGDLALSLSGKDKIALIHLWPHARPWRFARPEPMLRAIPEAERVGALLSQAMAAATGISAPAKPAENVAAEPAVPVRVRRGLATAAH
jgi:hypothetical protein